MKFKAYIKYSFIMSREAKLMGDNKITGNDFEFTFKDILGYYSVFLGKEIFIPPLFGAREIIIPWLQEGNIPQIILELPEVPK